MRVGEKEAVPSEKMKRQGSIEEEGIFGDFGVRETNEVNVQFKDGGESVLSNVIVGLSKMTPDTG